MIIGSKTCRSSTDEAKTLLRRTRTRETIAKSVFILLSTILAADEILVIKDGKIAERGVHSELVKAGGIYTELYETQFGKALDV